MKPHSESIVNFLVRYGVVERAKDKINRWWLLNSSQDGKSKSNSMHKFIQTQLNPKTFLLFSPLYLHIQSDVYFVLSLVAFIYIS
jgi:hypothetical protein